MAKRTSSFEIVMTAAMIVITLLIMIGLYNQFTAKHWEEKEELQVWDAKAPFGHYWVDTEGSFFLGSGEVDSTLSESYTIKYMEGDVLVTKIFSATGDGDGEKITVHLTNSTDITLTVTHHMTDDTFDRSPRLDYDSYELYLPSLDYPGPVRDSLLGHGGHPWHYWRH